MALKNFDQFCASMIYAWIELKFIRTDPLSPDIEKIFKCMTGRTFSYLVDPKKCAKKKSCPTIHADATEIFQLSVGFVK